MSIRYVTSTGPTVGPKAPAGSIILSLIALVDLTAGDFVNIVSSGGVAKAQRANATDASKPADGFVVESIGAGSTVDVYGPGAANTYLSGLTPGLPYFLDTTDGLVTATPPSGSGNLVQALGRAVSATALLFAPQPGVRL